MLHYTALSLEATLERFLDPTTQVSAHIVIGQAGEVYEVVPCFAGGALRAWHAGRSRLRVSDENGQERVVEGFNDRSIGIELVNLNGNLFEYTEAQYAALFEVIRRLQAVYPALTKPEAIVGHEQIAGFRGKADPGRFFSWERLFAVCYQGLTAPDRRPRCSEALVERVKQFCLQCQSPTPTVPRALHEASPPGMSPASAEEGAVQPPACDKSEQGPLHPHRLPARFFEGLSTLLEAVLSSEDG